MRPDQREGETKAKRMATILPFVVGGPSRRRPVGERTVTDTGQIVIFTGVRVEYGIPAAPAPAGKPRSGRRRTPPKDAALVV
jgi:hypothetical protein